MKKTKEEIEIYLKLLGIKQYAINDNLSVDVHESVSLSNLALDSIDIQFNKIGGDFDCANNKLASTNGFPSEVNGNFNCSNNQISSLVGGPVKVNDIYNCAQNFLVNLEGAPKQAKAFNCSYNMLKKLSGVFEMECEYFDCSNNHLTDLVGSPKEINGKFIATKNKLTSLKGVSDNITILHAEDNPLKCIADIQSINSLITSCNSAPLIPGFEDLYNKNQLILNNKEIKYRLLQIKLDQEIKLSNKEKTNKNKI